MLFVLFVVPFYCLSTSVDVVCVHSALYRIQVYMIISKNHNSLDCEQSLGLDIKQSPNAQDMFWPIPGLISYAGVIRSVGVLRHAHCPVKTMAI